MKKEPLFVAFSTQKGGVGKTTFTVLAASYLYYLKGYNVAVVDCDFPQYSIQKMRKRDLELIESDETYHRIAFEQFSKIGKKAYPIICASPDGAIDVANDFLDEDGNEYDVVFFDLPGTVNSPGVLDSLAHMDYIFSNHIRSSGIGKRIVLCRFYERTADYQSRYQFERIISLLEHGGRQGKNRLVYDL